MVPVTWETRAACNNVSGDKDGYPSCWRKLPHHPLGRFNGHPLCYVSSPQDKRETSVSQSMWISHTQIIHVLGYMLASIKSMTTLKCQSITATLFLLPFLFCVQAVHFMVCVVPYATLIEATTQHSELFIWWSLQNAISTKFSCEIRYKATIRKLKIFLII